MSKETITMFKASTGFQKVRLVCSVCKTTHTVRTHNKDMYTKFIRETWTCMICDLLIRSKNKQEERQNAKRNTITRGSVGLVTEVNQCSGQLKKSKVRGRRSN